MLFGFIFSLEGAAPVEIGRSRIVFCASRQILAWQLEYSFVSLHWMASALSRCTVCVVAAGDHFAGLYWWPSSGRIWWLDKKIFVSLLDGLALVVRRWPALVAW